MKPTVSSTKIKADREVAMRRTRNRGWLLLSFVVGVAVALSLAPGKHAGVAGTPIASVYASPALPNQDRGCDGTRLKVDVTSVGNSGVVGTASICVGEDGVRGKLKAENLTVGHGYTVWFFYIEGTNTGGPGRFDSTVAEDTDETFRGHVGGLQVSSGSTVKLLVFDHPDLGPNNVTRANNLLTPAGAFGVAQAVFDIP